MTLKLIEGFDWLPTSTDNATIQDLLGRFRYFFSAATVGSPPADWDIVTDSAFGYGKSLKVAYTDAQFNSTNQLLYPVGAVTEGFLGYRVKVGTTHQGYVGPCFYDAQAGLPQVSVRVGPNGMITVYRGLNGTGTVLAYSDAGVFEPNTWFFLEVRAKIHGSAGEVEVRVNTKTVISIVSTNTSSTGRAAFDMAGLRGRNSATFEAWVENQIFDDLYFCDTAGSVNNNFLGNVRVKAQSTTGNVHTDFTIGGTSPAATNWQSVQNSSLTDAQMVYSSTAGNYDLYTMDPNISAPYVHGVQIKSASRQDDATQRIMRNILKTLGGTTVEGANCYLNQTFSGFRDILEINPDTGVFFTGTEANGVQAGIKVQA